MPSRVRKRERVYHEQTEPGPGALVGIYARYSSDMQSGHSLESQVRISVDYALARKWVVQIYFLEESTSAKYDAEDLDQRPQFAAAMVAATTGQIQVILCHENDRWARNVGASSVSLAALRKAGVWWATADGKWDSQKIQQDGMDIAHVIDSKLNEAFIRRLSQKTVVGKESRALQGWHSSTAPFGYLPPLYPTPPPYAGTTWKAPRTIVTPDPESWIVLQKIAEWCCAGYSCREIADRLNALGYHPAGCKKSGPKETRVEGVSRFTKDTIRAIIINPFYREFIPDAGKGTIITPSGAQIMGLHEAAWEWDTWHKMLAAQSRLHHAPKATIQKREAYPFAGLMTCASCGQPINVWHTENHRYYVCRADRLGLTCSAARRTTNAQIVETTFGQFLTTYRLGETWEADLTALLNLTQDNTPHEGVEQERKKLERHLRNLNVQLDEETISKEEFRSQARALKTQIESLPRFDKPEKTQSTAMVAAKQLETIPDAWEVATLEERAELAQLLIAPRGLVWDHVAHQIMAITPNHEFLAPMAIALHGWQQVGMTLHRPEGKAEPMVKVPALAPSRSLSDEQEAQVMALLNSGLSIRQVAQQLQISRGVVYRVAQRYKG